MTRIWREPPGEWIEEFPGFVDHLDLASIDDLVDRHGFAKARDMIAQRLYERGGGRPAVVEHIREEDFAAAEYEAAKWEPH
jgi:hypothetical protein